MLSPLSINMSLPDLDNVLPPCKSRDPDNPELTPVWMPILETEERTTGPEESSASLDTKLMLPE